MDQKTQGLPRPNTGERTAWRIARWVLATGVVIGWVIMLHAPGTLPWLFIAAAGVAAVVIVSTLWLSVAPTSVRAHRHEPRSVKARARKTT